MTEPCRTAPIVHGCKDCNVLLRQFAYEKQLVDREIELPTFIAQAVDEKGPRRHRESRGAVADGRRDIEVRVVLLNVCP